MGARSSKPLHNRSRSSLLGFTSADGSAANSRPPRPSSRSGKGAARQGTLNRAGSRSGRISAVEFDGSGLSGAAYYHGGDDGDEARGGMLVQSPLRDRDRDLEEQHRWGTKGSGQESRDKAISLVTANRRDVPAGGPVPTSTPATVAVHNSGDSGGDGNSRGGSSAQGCTCTCPARLLAMAVYPGAYLLTVSGPILLRIASIQDDRTQRHRVQHESTGAVVQEDFPPELLAFGYVCAALAPMQGVLVVCMVMSVNARLRDEARHWATVLASRCACGGQWAVNGVEQVLDGHIASTSSSIGGKHGKRF